MTRYNSQLSQNGGIPSDANPGMYPGGDMGMQPGGHHGNQAPLTPSGASSGGTQGSHYNHQVPDIGTPGMPGEDVRIPQEQDLKMNAHKEAIYKLVENFHNFFLFKVVFCYQKKLQSNFRVACLKHKF